jgi:putative oxidoreductase
MTSATARIGWLRQQREAVFAGGETLAGSAHALMRVAIGALFLQHGLQKIFGLLGGFGAPGATAPLLSQFGFAGILEVVGGVLLIAGLAVRPVALVLIVEMIAAYFIAHAPQGGWPIQNGGELPMVYAAVFAFLAASGSGPFSIDRWLGDRKAAT